jgi:hypothetical protein
MDPYLSFFIFAAAAICWAFFKIGQNFAFQPDEQEMIRRLKEIRYARKMKMEADNEVEEWLRR